MRPFALLVLTLLTLGSPPATATSWDSMRGDCEDTAFRSWDEVELAKIASCVRLWEVYADDVTETELELKQGVIHAMRRLYMQGSAADQHIAKIALSRLGAFNLDDEAKRRTGGAKTKSRGGLGRARVCNPPTANPSDVAAGNRALSQGKRLYAERRFEETLDAWREMLERAPGWEATRYHMALIHAVLGQVDESLEHIECLQDLGTRRAIRLLGDARMERGFEKVRDQPRFKLATGYARIKVLDGSDNGRGRINADRLNASLLEVRHSVDGPVERDRVERPYPFIFYKHDSRLAAWIAKRVLRHPNTVFKRIDWDTRFDVIISWGDAPGSSKTWVPEPKEARRDLDSLAETQDDALLDPLVTMKRIDKAEDAPGRSPKGTKFKEGERDTSLEDAGKAGEAVGKQLGF